MAEINNEKLVLLFDKFKQDKKMLFIILIAFIGILLIFCSEISDTDEGQTENKPVSDSYTERNRNEELEAIISKVKGVGKVHVMISYEGSSESIYAYNTSEQIKNEEIKKDEEHIILDRGSVEDGLLLKEIYPRVTGVAVVCEGGGNATVKNEISQMLKALYGIGSNCISISEMKS